MFFFSFCRPYAPMHFRQRVWKIHGKAINGLKQAVILREQNQLDWTKERLLGIEGCTKETEEYEQRYYLERV